MRATGKYWWLLVISNGLTVVASLLVMLWKDGTGKFELWFDSEIRILWNFLTVF